jgi:hypothetical protein
VFDGTGKLYTQEGGGWADDTKYGASGGLHSTKTAAAEWEMDMP